MPGFESNLQGGLLGAVGRSLSNGTEVIDLFFAGSGPELPGLYHTWYGPEGWHQGTAGGLRFKRMDPTEVVFPFRPSAVSWAPDRLDVFCVDQSGHLWHLWSNDEEQPGTWFGRGEDLGRPPSGALFSSPTVVSTKPDSIAVFARTRLGSLWVCVWDPPHDTWTWRNASSGLGWHPQPTPRDFAPGACSWGTDRIDLFGVSGEHHHLLHTWQQDFPNDPHWHPDYWEETGAPYLTGSPVAVAWPDPQRIVVAYCLGGGDGLLPGSMGMTRWVGDHWEGVRQVNPTAAEVATYPALCSWGSARVDGFFFGREQGGSEYFLWHGWNEEAGALDAWQWEKFSVFQDAWFE